MPEGSGLFLSPGTGGSFIRTPHEGQISASGYFSTAPQFGQKFGILLSP
jgi:hypothetical protein